MADREPRLRLGKEADAIVLIPHHDCTVLLERAVRSVLDQSHGRLEVAIVDDASQDQEGFLGLRARIVDSRVVWLTTNRNVGPYRIYNRLLPSIAAPYVMLQDADDCSDRERLEVLLSEIESQRCDVLGSAVVRMFPDGHSEVHRYPHDVNHALRWWRRRNVFHGPTMLARTEFLRLLQGFDGHTKIAGDTEFICRAVFAGRVRNLDRPSYYYNMRVGSLTHTAATNFASSLRRAYVRRMHVRFYRNVLRRQAGALEPRHLRGVGTNLPFSIREV